MRSHSGNVEKMTNFRAWWFIILQQNTLWWYTGGTCIEARLTSKETYIFRCLFYFIPNYHICNQRPRLHQKNQLNNLAFYAPRILWWIPLALKGPTISWGSWWSPEVGTTTAASTFSFPFPSCNTSPLVLTRGAFLLAQSVAATNTCQNCVGWSFLPWPPLNFPRSLYFTLVIDTNKISP